MGKKMRGSRMKGIIGTVLALAMVMALAVPAPAADAAAKAEVTVTVTSPKTGAKLSGTKMIVHKKKSVQLSVKAKVPSAKTVNATSKATYKSSNPKVVSVNKKGKLTVKKNGTATITVKYKGVSKKIKLTVAGEHKWKAHKKTKTIQENHCICNCGVDMTYMTEEEDTEHGINHVLNHEPSNCYYELQTKKVTYTDYYYCTCGAKKAGEPEPQSDY